MKDKTQTYQYVDTPSNFALIKQASAPTKEQLDGLQCSTYIFTEDNAFYIYNKEEAELKKIKLTNDILPALKIFIEDKVPNEHYSLSIETLKQLNSITQHAGTAPEAQVSVTTRSVKSKINKDPQDTFTTLESKSTPIVQGIPIEKGHNEFAKEFSSNFNSTIQEARLKIGAGIKQMALKSKPMEEALIDEVVNKEKEYTSLLNAFKKSLQDMSIKGTSPEKNSSMLDASRLAKIEKATTKQLSTILQAAFSRSGGSLDQITYQVSSHLTDSFVDMKNKIKNIVEDTDSETIDVSKQFPEKNVNLLTELKAIQLEPHADSKQLALDLINTLDKAISQIKQIQSLEQPEADDLAMLETQQTKQEPIETTLSTSGTMKKDYLSLIKKEQEALQIKYIEQELIQAQNAREKLQQELNEYELTLEKTRQERDEAREAFLQIQQLDDEIQKHEAAYRELETLQQIIKEENKTQTTLQQELEILQEQEDAVKKLEVAYEELQTYRQVMEKENKTQAVLQQELGQLALESDRLQQEELRRRAQKVASLESYVRAKLNHIGNSHELFDTMIGSLSVSIQQY